MGNGEHNSISLFEKTVGFLGLQLSIAVLICEGGNFGYGGADLQLWKAFWEKEFCGT